MKTLLDEIVSEREFDLEAFDEYGQFAMENEVSSSQFTLNKLKCHTTEDYFGADDCLLKIYVDSALKKTMRRKMNDGQLWQLSLDFSFKDKLVVKLWDEDWPDPDDLIGTLTIDNNSTSGTKQLRNGRAHYSITYSVKHPRPVTPSMPGIETPWITGIDVSKHQGEVDWKKVAAAGHEFAFIKATEGFGYVDPRFDENWKECKAAGMIRGAYHFARVNSPIEKDAREEAEHFATTVGKLGPGDFPLVLDIEWGGAKGIKSKEIVPWCQAFLKTAHDLSNRKPIVYTGYNFWRWKLAKTEVLSGYTLWQVYYSSKAKAPKPINGWAATFWQWSHSRPVHGIKTKTVDENRFLGTQVQLERLAGR